MAILVNRNGAVLLAVNEDGLSRIPKAMPHMID